MKKTIVILLVSLVALLMASQYTGLFDACAEQDETESLRQAHRKYLDAWSNRDIDTIVKMGTGAVGYGHSTAFARPIRVTDTFREGVTKFYAMMDVFTINVLTENYRVDGTTGLAWGHYASNSKQKDGPLRTIYQRYAHTFVRDGDSWRLVMYHRSLLPTEDMQ